MDFDNLNIVVAGNSVSDEAKKLVLLPFINTNWAKKKLIIFFILWTWKYHFVLQEFFIQMFDHMNQALREVQSINCYIKLSCVFCDMNYSVCTTRPINARAPEHCVKISLLLRAHKCEECNLNLNKKKRVFSVSSSGRSLFDLRVEEQGILCWRAWVLIIIDV